MKSFDRNYLERLAIPHRLITTIRQIGEYKGRQELYKQQAPEMLENLRKVAIIQSTESSNRLEGITADFKKIKELVEEKTAPANRSEAEIAGYRDVLNTIHTNYEHIPFTANVVLQLHRDLMKYTETKGGRWKSAPNEIVEFLPDAQNASDLFPSSRIRLQNTCPDSTNDIMRLPKTKRLTRLSSSLSTSSIFSVSTHF